MTQNIVLVSNASMDIYPSNKLSDFRVRLPQPLAFNSNYRVALTRISFTKSYFNYNTKSVISVILSDGSTDYTTDESSWPKCAIRSPLVPGHYNPESFIAMINAQITANIKIDGKDKMKSLPVYSLVNGYLTVTPGVYTNSDGAEIKWEMKFSNPDKKILGIFDQVKRPVYLNQGLTDLFVYTDLVYPSVVGDTTCELLAILDGQTDRGYGTHCCETFEDPWFHALAKNTFQEIRVYIRTDTGEAPPFKFGRVNLRLTFKPEDGV